MATNWQEAVEREINQKFVGLSSLSGGDFAESSQGLLSGGGKVFVKTHRNPPEGFFSTEAAGLRWLAVCEAVSIPAVIAVADEPPYLVLQWIEQGNPSSQTEERLGQSLARLHGCGHPVFGRSDGRSTGSLALSNRACQSWAEFFSTRRLLPLARIAADRNALPPRDISALEKLANRLDQLDVPVEPPAMLHGDLWAGNRMVDTLGDNWLIDPAAHGGHREFDLAMMKLFGGFGNRCFEAYNECFPLVAGWKNRVPLHQLAPLVIHAIKFGGGYAADVRSALAQYS